MQVRRAVRCLVSVCFVVLAGLIVLSWFQARARERTLPDGSRVVFRGISYGSTHRFPLGSFWRQIAIHVLPAKYAPRSATLIYNDTNSGPTMIVWIEHVAPATNGDIQYGGHPAFGDPPDWQGVFDDSGTDFEGYRPECLGSTGRGLVQGFVFHALPGASRELHFRFVCADMIKGWQYSTVFSFPNPIFRPGSQRRPEFPLTVTNANLTFVLTGFHPEPRRPRLPKRMNFSFDLFENGKPADNWELHSLSVLDRNDAAYHPYSSGWGRSDNHTAGDFVGGLGANAPWKLRFGLKRSTFSGNELCTVRGLPIASEGGVETNLARISIQGTTLVIRRDAGSGYLTAMIDPPDENYFLRSVDIPAANGQPFDRGKTYDLGETDTKCVMGFPPGVTNVNLTFGVTRKVFIEVVARPAPP